MYRYCKGAAQRSEWVLVDGETPETHLTSYGTKATAFYTVLFLDRPLKEDSDFDEVKYQGPFYVDIDAADIDESIASAKYTLRRLLDLGVPENRISIYATGKKGFHFEVPMNVFTVEAPVQDLPAIYRVMARELGLPLYDDSVYSAGKGRMWRMPNVVRPDNGAYKVPISAEELRTLDEDTYRVLVAEPRHRVFADGVNGFAATFAALFKGAQMQVAARPKFAPMQSGRDLFKGLEGDVPECMKRVAAGQDLNPEVNFNDRALQFVKGLIEWGQDPDALIEQMAETNPSRSYPTARDRRRELIKKYRTIGRQAAYTFTCHGIKRTLVDRSICEQCPVRSKLDSVDGTGVIEYTAGYARLNRRGQIEYITNFRLEPVEEFVALSQEFNVVRRIAVTAEITDEHGEIHLVKLDEESWASRHNLLKALFGVRSNAVFLGNETDVQMLKRLLLDPKRVKMMTRILTERCGIHRTEIGGVETLTYVEPGWSVNNYGIANTYLTQGRIPAAPKLAAVEMPGVGSPELELLEKTLRNLLKINKPAVVAQILGWFGIASLKEHFNHSYKEFPLLNLAGESGAGKTGTAFVMSCLHGVDFITDGGTIDLSNTTDFPFWSYCASSTTVVRLCEEFNRHLLVKNWASVMNAFKAAFNGNAVSRGTLSKAKLHGESSSGATTIEYHLTAPILFTSEQPPKDPALVQRTVTVAMSKEGRGGLNDIEPESTKAYNYVFKNRRRLLVLAKALTMIALTTSTADAVSLVKAYDEAVPRSLGERPKLSYQYLLAGLDHWIYVLDRIGLRMEPEIEALREALLEHIRSNVETMSREKRFAEHDRVLEAMALMAGTVVGTSRRSKLLELHEHYVVNGDHLFLDLPLCHSAYLLYAQRQRMPVAIDTPQQMRELVRSEAYCIQASATVPGFGTAGSVMQLSLSGMARKGIAASRFGEL